MASDDGHDRQDGSTRGRVRAAPRPTSAGHDEAGHGHDPVASADDAEHAGDEDGRDGDAHVERQLVVGAEELDDELLGARRLVLDDEVADGDDRARARRRRARPSAHRWRCRGRQRVRRPRRRRGRQSGRGGARRRCGSRRRRHGDRIKAGICDVPTTSTAAYSGHGISDRRAARGRDGRRARVAQGRRGGAAGRAPARPRRTRDPGRGPARHRAGPRRRRLDQPPGHEPRHAQPLRAGDRHERARGRARQRRSASRRPGPSAATSSTSTSTSRRPTCPPVRASRWARRSSRCRPSHTPAVSSSASWWGPEALRHISTKEGQALRMRGANTRVVRSGVVRPGDRARKLYPRAPGGPGVLRCDGSARTDPLSDDREGAGA